MTHLPSQTAAPAKPNPWLYFAARRPSPRLRLFCFPYSGGSAGIFRLWPARLGNDDIDVVGVELPGRAWRRSEPLYTGARQAAQAFCDAVAGELSVPFAFYGHSVGALLAYEIAHTLRSRGLPRPLALFLSGRKPPHDPKHNISYSTLPDNKLLSNVAELGAMPGAVLKDPDLRQMIIDVLRADLTIAEQYSYVDRSPLEEPLFVYASEADPLVDLADVRGWERHTSARCKLRQYRGGHFFINDGTNRFFAELAEDLRGLSLPEPRLDVRS